MAFTFSEQIRAFYEKYDEANRLATNVFQLEFVRTPEILLRHFPAPPATVLDIGGGPGIYIFYFTEAYFHRTEELEAELAEAGFQYEKALAIEGPGGWLQNFDAWWNDAARRERLLNLIRKLESEPSLIGASAHVMGIARKP